MTALESILLAEIERESVIPFDRFMRLALYHPQDGYYERGVSVGRAGDFYTSVSVGRLFAELVVGEFSRWVSGVIPDGVVQWVECGAHHGQFAADFLDAIGAMEPELSARLIYVIVEPSQRRRERQGEALARYAPRVLWVEGMEKLGERSIRGVVFSNELLDAMPVQRYGWDARSGRWFEWGMAMGRGEWVWERIPLTAERSRGLNRFLEGLSAGDRAMIGLLESVLPDGFTLDLSEEALAWWGCAAARLELGRLMAFDYGLSRMELMSAGRSAGTLRAYHEHRLTDQVLSRVGEQDLTAHVDWDGVEECGRGCGLRTIVRMQQGRWLAGLTMQGQVIGPGLERQFQTLVHPAHLGATHSILIQAR